MGREDVALWPPSLSIMKARLYRHLLLFLQTKPRENLRIGNCKDHERCIVVAMLQEERMLPGSTSYIRLVGRLDAKWGVDAGCG